MSIKNKNRKNSPLKKTNAEKKKSNKDVNVNDGDEKYEEQVKNDNYFREARYKCIKVPDLYVRCNYKLTEDKIYESVNRLDDTIKIKDDSGKFIEVCAVYFKQV